MKGELNADAIELLLQNNGPRKFVSSQTGPLRYYDNPHRCLSRGCGASTNYKVDGIWYCTVHALNKLNEQVEQLTQNRANDLVSHPFFRLVLERVDELYDGLTPYPFYVFEVSAPITLAAQAFLAFNYPNRKDSNSVTETSEKESAAT